MKPYKEYTGITVKISNYFRDFYWRYCKNILKLKKKDIIYDTKDLFEIHRCIWQTIKEHYVHNEGGVHISNLGYFAHIVYPKQKLFRKKRVLKYVYTKGYQYISLLFSPEYGSKKYTNYYYMMNDTSYEVKREIETLMKGGLRYRFMDQDVEFNKQFHPDYKLKYCFSKSDFK